MAAGVPLSLKDVKHIDKYEENIVNGYVKRAQKLLPSNVTYYIIPTLIIHWILLYFHEPEKFDITKYASDKYEISKDNTVITQAKGWQGGTIGLVIVWEFGQHSGWCID